jgi:hypothetical protein
VMPHPPVHTPDDMEVMTEVDHDPVEHTDVETVVDAFGGDTLTDPKILR